MKTFTYTRNGDMRLYNIYRLFVAHSGKVNIIDSSYLIQHIFFN